MGELVRVYHAMNVPDAQKVVNALAEVRIPVVWSDGHKKRILQPALKVPEQLVLPTKRCRDLELNRRRPCDFGHQVSVPGGGKINA